MGIREQTKFKSTESAFVPVQKPIAQTFIPGPKVTVPEKPKSKPMLAPKADNAIRLGGKKSAAWPPRPHEGEPGRIPWGPKSLSQSMEHLPVTEAPSMPMQPQEAPPVMYASSSTINDNRKSWHGQTVTTKITEEMMKEEKMSQQKTTTQTSFQLPPAPAPARTPSAAPKPRPHSGFFAPVLMPSAPINQGMDRFARSSSVPLQNSQSSGLPTSIPKARKPAYPLADESDYESGEIIPMPDLQPFPFTVEPPKPKKPRGPTPVMPKKFVPSGPFSDSDYKTDYNSLDLKGYMSDSDAAYRPINVKLQKGRTRKNIQEPPAPSQFDTIPKNMGPIRPSINRLTYPSDYESDIPTSRESTPVRLDKPSQGHYLGFGPILLNTAPAKSYTQPKSQQPQQRYQGPGPTPQPLFKASSLPPPETTKPVATSQPIMNGVDNAPQPRGRGVKGTMKMFDTSGPPPMPPSLPGVTAKPRAPESGAPPATVIASPITSPEPTVARVKPSSPKMKKKTESVQMNRMDLEESGYAADNEATLPRQKKIAATAASFSSSQSSTSSITKHESIKSSSFSSSQQQFSQQQTGGGSFSSSPASSFGQTTFGSSSFKKTESKTSQVKQIWSDL